MRDCIPPVAPQYGFSGSLQDYYRFLLRFDVHTAVCVAQGESLQAALRGPEGAAPWEKSWNASRFKEELLRTRRKYFYFSLQHDSINVFYTAFRGAVHTFLLCLLAREAPPDQWEQMLDQWVQRFPPSWLGRDCGEIQSDYLCGLRRMREAAGLPELYELRHSLGNLEAAATDMELALEKLRNREAGSLQGAGSVRTRTRERSPFDLQTNLQKVRLICLLECSENEQTVPDGHGLDVLEAKWADFFPDAPFGEQEERGLSRILALQRPRRQERSRPAGRSELSKYYRAMGVALNNGGVKNVESTACLNSILLMRAVMMTMAYANLDKLASRAEDTLLADVLSYLENVTYMASDKENSIALEFIGLFRTNGIVDRECVLFTQKYRSVLSKNFNAVCKAMEQKNRNIRQVTNLSDRLREMEGSLRNADFTVKRDIVLGLDRGSYGHRLGELYRFAEGLDDRDAKQVQELLGCIFQMLGALGITPVSQERLDECIGEEDALYDCTVPEGNLVREGLRILRYPGWSVHGVQVVPPVYTTEQRRNDE